MDPEANWKPVEMTSWLDMLTSYTSSTFKPSRAAPTRVCYNSQVNPDVTKAKLWSSFLRETGLSPFVAIFHKQVKIFVSFGVPFFLAQCFVFKICILALVLIV